MRDYQMMENGNIIGTLEEFYVVETNNSDFRTGSNQTSYTYCYNTIICYSINPEGEFLWLKKVPKSANLQRRWRLL